jgi:hypothetical protein
MELVNYRRQESKQLHTTGMSATKMMSGLMAKGGQPTEGQDKICMGEE